MCYLHGLIGEIYYHRKGREAEWFVHYEERWNWRQEGGSCSCSVGNDELHCPSTEPVTNASASGPVPSSFENTDHLVSFCESQSCILAQEEEQELQSGDPPLTECVLLC